MKKTTTLSLLLIPLFTSTSCLADTKSPAMLFSEMSPIFASPVEEAETTIIGGHWPAITDPLDAAPANLEYPNDGFHPRKKNRERHCRRIQRASYSMCENGVESDARTASKFGFDTYENAALRLCRSEAKRDYTKCINN